MSAKQKFLMSLAALVIIAMAAFIVFGDNGVLDLQRLRSKNHRLVETNEALARENLMLHRQIQRLKNDHAYIESIARRELGMIKAEEVILKPSGSRQEKK